jgi:riboflavin synthase alpha subunit/very-short-patch-repair endonuclease
MFTGIIESTASVESFDGSRLTVERPKIFDDLKIGSSISVAGVCLTVVKLTKSAMSFDLTEETLAKTRLKELQKDDYVNLERAMKADARLEGHIVQGHVEGVGVVHALSSIPLPLPPREEGVIPWKKKPTRPNILFFAREMRKEPTEAEAILWEAIRHDQLGVRFRRQYPIGGRILDFYCPSNRLGIELDGGIHRTMKAKSEDAFRDEYLLEDHNIHVIRFPNQKVFKDLNEVLSVIKEKLLSAPPPVEEGSGVEETQGATLIIAVPRNLLSTILPKGSIAIDGVSLTVASIQNDAITIALIPHTIKNTTLGSLKEGDHVNVETDVLVRMKR